MMKANTYTQVSFLMSAYDIMDGGAKDHFLKENIAVPVEEREVLCLFVSPSSFLKSFWVG